MVASEYLYCENCGALFKISVLSLYGEILKYSCPMCGSDNVKHMNNEQEEFFQEYE